MVSRVVEVLLAPRLLGRPTSSSRNRFSDVILGWIRIRMSSTTSVPDVLPSGQ